MVNVVGYLSRSDSCARSNETALSARGGSTTTGTSKAATKATEISAVHAHCGVYTQPRVAEAILDRIGWTVDADLSTRTLLEPSCGNGSFLIPAAMRLLANVRRLGMCNEHRLQGAIVAFEFDATTANALRAKVRALLKDAGLAADSAIRVAASWVRCKDFLLANDLPEFSDVVGNPPYMRWSKIPPGLRAAYEQRLPTHAARGDLCLAFVCRSVDLLRAKDARVAFLCADRWLRCAYGAKARVELERSSRLALHVEVHGLPVFLGPRKVGAYAAISILERELDGPAAIHSATSLEDLVRTIAGPRSETSRKDSARLAGTGGAVLAGAGLAAAFEQIVASAPRMEDAAVTVRCGLALGYAPAFVIEGRSNIEKSRLVPWVRTGDLREDGSVEPSARLVNVWDERGNLISLARFPILASHLSVHRTNLSKRACVSSPDQWYRTIDRLHRDRMNVPALFVAGMSKYARVAMTEGGVQASNALYQITSTEWPLRVLFALFRSGLLDVFATVLSPRFAGGIKRFDGNVLRQVRLPRWNNVDAHMRERLEGVDTQDSTPRPELIADLFGIKSAASRDALVIALSRD